MLYIPKKATIVRFFEPEVLLFQGLYMQNPHACASNPSSLFDLKVLLRLQLSDPVELLQMDNL